MISNKSTLHSNLFECKSTFRIGYCNVRTMHQIGKCAQVCSEMKNYDLDILGVSECRWTNAGKQLLFNENLHIIYSGRNDDQHSEGVAILMTHRAEGSLISWQPVNERIITVRYPSKYFKLSVIQCYVQTNDNTDAQKHSFYNLLTDTISKIPNHDCCDGRF